MRKLFKNIFYIILYIALDIVSVLSVIYGYNAIIWNLITIISTFSLTSHLIMDYIEYSDEKIREKYKKENGMLKLEKEEKEIDESLNW